MKNYEAMTDQQINREVASWFYCPNWLSRHAEKLGMIPDYCNDPSSAWEIIVDNGISIDYWGDKWGADIQLDGEIAFEHEDSRPLKAAMICFLKMKDADQ